MKTIKKTTTKKGGELTQDDVQGCSDRISDPMNRAGHNVCRAWRGGQTIKWTFLTFCRYLLTVFLCLLYYQPVWFQVAAPASLVSLESRHPSELWAPWHGRALPPNRPHRHTPPWRTGEAKQQKHIKMLCFGLNKSSITSLSSRGRDITTGPLNEDLLSWYGLSQKYKNLQLSSQ